MNKWARRLAAVLGGLAIGAVAAEIAARTVTPSPGEQLLFSAPDVTPKGMYSYSPTLLTAPTPGFTGEVASLGYRVPIRINSLGTRGPEPGPGRHWLALGDSFVMAAQVPEAETFEARLGEKMGVEVLDAGSDGYSTWQELVRYRELDDRAGADTVVVVFFLGNDLDDNVRVPPMLRNPMPPPPAPPNHVEVTTSPLMRFLYTNSYAFGYARVAMKRRTVASDADGRRFREEILPFTVPGRTRLHTILPASQEPLRQLRDEARARGDRLLVVVAPPAFVVDPQVAASTFDLFGLTQPDLDAPRDAVLEILSRFGIPACDLTPALSRAVEAGVKPYFRFDGHWSAAGHAVVADEIARCLGG